MSSLYVHIPFCYKKCLFCSFVVSIGQAHRVDDYLSCLAAEAALYAPQTMGTVYIGGGTPTFLNANQLRSLFHNLSQRFDFRNASEITIEANPEGIAPDRLKVLADSGVNRISLGVQSFNERYLQFLGRNHDAGTARAAYDQVRGAGFSNVSMDLMFSFPGQTLEELRADILAMAKLNPEHISLYGLTIEENSRFHARHVTLDDSERQAEQYSLILDLLKEHGYRQYEVSNFAKPGFESRHNQNYWQGGNYIGLGVGAHSHLNGRRSWNVSTLPEYMAKIQQGSAEEGSELLEVETRLSELVLFGLRMNDGVALADAEAKAGVGLNREKKSLLDRYVADKFLEYNNGVYRATRKGILVLDEISARLI